MTSVSGSSSTPNRRSHQPATALRSSGSPSASGYVEISVRLSARARLIIGSVGSRGSPLPKSISSTPSAASRRFASSSLTNGYVPVAARAGESSTPGTLSRNSLLACIITAVIQRQPDPAPERGVIAAGLAQGVDSEDELAELRELART